jgi:hypothetical protein
VNFFADWSMKSGAFFNTSHHSRLCKGLKYVVRKAYRHGRAADSNAGFMIKIRMVSAKASSAVGS